VNQSVQVTLTGTARTANAAVNTDDLRLTTPLRGGKVKRLGDDRIEYTPPQDFVGSDQFTYAPRSGPDATVVHTVVVRVVRP
jgi:Bacterial Ig domain